MCWYFWQMLPPPPFFTLIVMLVRNWFLRNCKCLRASSKALSVSSEILSALFFISATIFSWSYLAFKSLFWIISRSSTNQSKHSSSKYVLVLFAVSSIDATRWHFLCEGLANVAQQGSSWSWQNNVIGITWWWAQNSPFIW